jgi:hypothetical protein
VTLLKFWLTKTVVSFHNLSTHNIIMVFCEDFLYWKCEMFLAMLCRFLEFSSCSFRVDSTTFMACGFHVRPKTVESAGTTFSPSVDWARASGNPTILQMGKKTYVQSIRRTDERAMPLFRDTACSVRLHHYGDSIIKSEQQYNSDSAKSDNRKGSIYFLTLFQKHYSP